MEAEAFLEVSTALESETTRVKLPLPHPPGIDKIVWSVWDYILGPELMFSWEAVPAEVAPSGNDDLNLTRSSDGLEREELGQGLEYDPDFQGNYLRTPVVFHACGNCNETDCFGNCDFEPVPTKEVPPEEGEGALGGGLEDSQTSASTVVADEEEEEETEAEESALTSLRFSLANNSVGELENREAWTPGRRVSSEKEKANGRAKGHGTRSISETSSVTVLTEGASGYTSVSHSQRNSLSIDDSGSSKSDEEGEGGDVQSVEDDCGTPQVLPSSLPASVSTPVVENGNSPPMLPASQGGADDLPSASCSIAEGPSSTAPASPPPPSPRPLPLSDERYAAIHSLSTEIYRRHMAEHTVDSKFFLVPDRSLVIGSFSFTAHHKDTKAIHSVSLLLDERRLEWYLARLSWFQQYFYDLVPRLKASLAVETFEEILSRMTTEWTQLLQTLSTLEQSSLCLPCNPKIQDTHLGSPKLTDNAFIQRCIMAHLLTMGQTFVISKDPKLRLKWLRTLSMFTPREEKWCGIDAPSNLYSPYIKLQGGTKAQTERFLSEGCNSPWPVGLLDADAKTVKVSGPYWIQRRVKTQAQKRDLLRILGPASSAEKLLNKKLKLELKQVAMEGSLVKDLLTRMDLLPYDNAVREGFVQQFLRFLAQKAFAFVSYVQAVTDSGLEPKKLKIQHLRKALDLTQDGDFWIVLPFAERMKPQITEMLFCDK